MIDSLLAELKKTNEGVWRYLKNIRISLGANVIKQRKDRRESNIVSSYPDDLEDTLAAELIQFAAFARTQKPVTVNESAELWPCTSFCHR